MRAITSDWGFVKGPRVLSRAIKGIFRQLVSTFYGKTSAKPVTVYARQLQCSRVRAFINIFTHGHAGVYVKAIQCSIPSMLCTGEPHFIRASYISEVTIQPSEAYTVPDTVLRYLRAMYTSLGAPSTQYWRS